MPTYTYSCPECKLEIEYVHKITEDPVYICPECTETDYAPQMHRIIVLSNTGNGFVLKGTCWSKDGYKK